MPLRRRDFLAGAGATAAALLAGCADEGSNMDGPGRTAAGPGPDPTETETPTVTPLLPSNLNVTRLRPRAEGDRTVVEVGIENDGDQPGGGTLIVMATINDEQVRQRQDVSLEPGTSRTYNVTFDVSADEITDISAVDFEWESNTGATTTDGSN